MVICKYFKNYSMVVLEYVSLDTPRLNFEKTCILTSKYAYIKHINSGNSISSMTSSSCLKPIFVLKVLIYIHAFITHKLPYCTIVSCTRI